MELTYDVAKATLLKLANERPDYVHTSDPKVISMRAQLGGNESCYYRLGDGTPGCIIGALVAELFPDVDLEEGASAACAMEEAGISLDQNTRHLTNRAQSNQDTGHGWAESVSQAIDSVESH
jgi:hypothetical protein